MTDSSAVLTARPGAPANPNSATFTHKELLEECWKEQRSEISYRRDREQATFQLSATIWLGILGALVLNVPKDGGFLKKASTIDKWAVTVVLIGAASLVHGWIAKQRKARSISEKALASIQKQAGCYTEDSTGNTILPAHFYFDYSLGYGKSVKRFRSYKLIWTWILPGIVILCLWVLGT